MKAWEWAILLGGGYLAYRVVSNDLKKAFDPFSAISGIIGGTTSTIVTDLTGVEQSIANLLGQAGAGFNQIIHGSGSTPSNYGAPTNPPTGYKTHLGNPSYSSYSTNYDTGGVKVQVSPGGVYLPTPFRTVGQAVQFQSDTAAQVALASQAGISATPEQVALISLRARQSLLPDVLQTRLRKG